MHVFTNCQFNLAMKPIPDSPLFWFCHMGIVHCVKEIFELLQCEYVSLLRLDKMGNNKLVQHFHLSPIMFFLLFILVFDLDMS